MKCKFWLFSLIFACTAFFGQNSPHEISPELEEVDSVLSAHYKDMLPADSLLTENFSTNSVVYPRVFPANLKSKYKGPEFDYTTIKPKESVWERIRRRIAEILQSIFGHVDTRAAGNITMIVIRLFAIILGGFLLYVLIRYLLGKDGNFFFSRKNKKVEIRDENLEENIHEIIFPEEILKYEKEGNYRYAVRYQFLKVLKNLSDRKLIEWVPEKTNRDYISELKSSEQSSDFTKLVRIFDYVWYGEFDISRNSYAQFKEVFNSFKV